MSKFVTKFGVAAALAISLGFTGLAATAAHCSGPLGPDSCQRITKWMALNGVEGFEPDPLPLMPLDFEYATRISNACKFNTGCMAAVWGAEEIRRCRHEIKETPYGTVIPMNCFFHEEGAVFRLAKKYRESINN